ncbi:MAG: HIT family protein [Rhodanobacteraceae bacterium]|nr:HIT family protein [Rhodanobacteraceae bacterium]
MRVFLSPDPADALRESAADPPNPDERAELISAIDTVSSIIRERGGIDGFNLGVNVGAAAGQTVPHLHQHVIPRRTGDMPDPRGGVRHVIPGKGNYLITRDAPRGPSIADAGPGQRWRIDSPPLLTTGPAHSLSPHLENDLSIGGLGTSSISMPLSGILCT